MPRTRDLLVTDRWAIDPTGLLEHINVIRRYPPLSELELIDAAITFANTGDERAYSLLRIGVRLPEQRLDEVTGEYMRRSELWLRGKSTGETLIEYHRKVLRWHMEAIAYKHVTRELLSTWRRHAEGLMLLPEYSDDGSTHYRYIAFRLPERPPIPPVAHVLLLIACGPQAGRLCQCKLDTCGRFFRAVQPKGGMGAPIRDYCPETDHRERAHQAAAPERMRKSRERARSRARSKQPRRRS